jgi:hypothetical protein
MQLEEEEGEEKREKATEEVKRQECFWPRAISDLARRADRKPTHAKQD